VRHHVVDTFADERFAGNPAAVVPAPAFPGDAEMQDVARRIGLPTTAFVVPAGPGEYGIRWFTPHAEITLCGHATIASARYLFGAGDARRTTLRFVSPRGVLLTERAGDLVSIDLPAARLTPVAPPPGLLEALGVGALGTGALSCTTSDDDVLVELADAAAVAAVRPDFAALAAQPFRGHVVTAPGPTGVDFASRTFFPSLGVDEDQVCVSAHCGLAPFWARRLGRRALSALQLSGGGGRLAVEDRGDRVRVFGSAVVRGGVREPVAEELAG